MATRNPAVQPCGERHGGGRLDGSRSSSHSRSRAWAISRSVTSASWTFPDDSSAKAFSPMREAPSADAAAESTGASTGPPAENAACRLLQCSGSTATTGRSGPRLTLSPAARPPPPTETATESHHGACLAISSPIVP